MSAGKNFLAALLAGSTVSDLIKFGTIDHLFKNTEVGLYAVVKEFVKTYGALPTHDVILEKTGETLTTVKEPPAYFLDTMKTRFEEVEVKKTLNQAQDALKAEGAGVGAAVGGMTEMVLRLTRLRYNSQIVDLREAYDAILGTYLAQWKPETNPGLMLGWPSLDEMTRGLRLGDKVAYVGRPGIGKTFQMLYGAHHGWAKAEADPLNPKGSSRLFVSMEMDIVPIEQRLVAMHTHLPMSGVKNAALDNADLKTLKKGVKAMAGFKAPFWIVDGNLTATVEDVLMLCRQLKPDAVFIDGAYLLKHPTERDRYKRVSENAELLKKRIANEIAPCVCSWQFAKTASKKKKEGEEVTLDDIAYADAIAQVSSLVLGIFEEETVETIKQRRVKILKGRSGETGEFKARWDFDKMDFSEILPASEAEPDEFPTE